MRHISEELITTKPCSDYWRPNGEEQLNSARFGARTQRNPCLLKPVKSLSFNCNVSLYGSRWHRPLNSICGDPQPRVSRKEITCHCIGSLKLQPGLGYLVSSLQRHIFRS